MLLLDPLFYMQSMMAQLDMPAMLFTVLALLLFLDDRHVAAALASTALVLAKETGALLPLILAGVLLFDRPRAKYAAYYLAPFAALGRLVLRPLAHHRASLRRRGIHALQPRLRAAPCARGALPDPAHLLPVHRRLPLGRIACNFLRLEAHADLCQAASGKSRGCFWALML